MVHIFIGKRVSEKGGKEVAQRKDRKEGYYQNCRL